MKFLPILLLLCSFTLTAQDWDENVDDLRYVWAESGLTLRAEGNSGATRLALVPYGARVRITGQEGEYTSVKVLRPLTLNANLQSKGWAMEDSFLEVEWEGKTGWLYGGYVSRLPVPAFGRPFLEEWLIDIGGQPDTVMNSVRLPDQGGITTLVRYANGITVSGSMGEGWGATVITIPLLLFNDGFLIADKFYGLTEGLENKRRGVGEGEEGMAPMVLELIEYEYLLFTDELSKVEIRRVGNVVVITSEGAC